MKKIISISACFLILSSFLLWFSNWQSTVPRIYYPNSEISTNFDRIIKNFASLEAYRTTNTDVPVEIFSQLKSDFDKVFPYFPKTPNYSIVYEQCRITTDSLIQWYTYDKMLTFRTRCFVELNNIINQISSNFSVKASIIANPRNWSAPINVTFDARWSVDPSNDTIPSNNFYWYYRDTSWIERVIWQWPVVNHTFTQPWTYVVHLTVRSANHLSSWIFDWSANVSISVWPQSAILSAYANWQRLDKDNIAKVWTTEARNWIILDWSWTYPTWWRQITEHRWSITWPDNFNFSRTSRWNPWSLRVQLPNNWQYFITLSIKDNENNNLSQEFPLIVSDPVAKIRVNPQSWNTSTVFKFDASASYSIQSRIRTYRWTIFDPNWNQIDSFESRNFDRKFARPWNYNVRLTAIDELWNQNDETYKLYVESTKPIPNFTPRPIQDWEKPSQFLLDATSTYDIDVLNWFWSLTYDWNFSNRNNVEIARTFDWWERILVSFNEPWEYDVQLTARDSFWQSNTIERKIKIDSSLRPVLSINPFSTHIWESLNFTVDSNKTISYYEWNFWDWTPPVQTQQSTFSHSYRQAWVYNVTVRVASPSWDTNTVRRQVFIWQKWHPNWSFEVSFQNTILMPDTICEVEENWKIVQHAAFDIDRYQNISINARESVNSHWRKDNLRISFRPQNDQIYPRDTLSYRFNEIGCLYIDLTVEDNSISKIDRKRIWFNVNNAKPLLDNITMTFPQYWNEVWVWFWAQQTQADMFETQYDPLIVRVQAQNPRDPDWHISHFIRYYYKSDNPDRILEVKTSPANMPNSVFSIPRMPWEFVFWVRIVDNDWAEIDSESIIWKWPSVFFPPSTENPDIPIVSLRTSQRNTVVWEEVEFIVTSRVLWNNTDFQANRTIRFDFNWDWNYDLTTKSDRVFYTYEAPGDYRPRVQVVYRWYAWVDVAETINVLEWLSVWLLYDKLWNTVLFRDTSIWDIESSTLCLDVVSCRNNDNSFIVENQKELVFHYDEYWRKAITFDVKDKYWNSDTKRESIEIFELDEDFKIWLISIPSAEIVDWTYNIDVWRSLNNTVNYYIKSNIDWLCYIDFDITYDSTWDWQPDNDKDLLCNQLWTKSYVPQATSTIARLYFEEEWEVIYKDININFLDFDINLSDEQLEIYKEITDIINILPTDTQDMSFLRTLLINLRNSIWDWIWVDWIVIQVYDWFDFNVWLISYEIEERILIVLDKLTSVWIQAAIWGSQYEIAKANIIIFMPSSVEWIVRSIFEEIELSQWDKEYVKVKLQELLDLAASQMDIWNIDAMDYNIIQSDICEILDYYDIQSTLCWTNLEADIEVDSWWSIFSLIFKIIIYVIIFVVFLFVILVAVFAIKAKWQSNEQKEEDEE